MNAARPVSAPPADGEHFDVVVIGAGLGGLVAGALLARAGRSVLLVERHTVAGGNATVFRRRGYVFDVGLHYIGGCDGEGPLPAILHSAGADGIVFNQLDPDGYDEVLLPGLRFAFPRGREAFRQRLHAQFPSERAGIDRHVRLLAELERVLPLMHRPAALGLALLRSPLLLRHRGATFAQFLDTCTRDPALRAVLGAQHIGYALPPSRASVLVAAGITAHYLQGAFYPRGGGQVLADGLADALLRAGGRLALRTTAARIVLEHGAVAAVELLRATGERLTVRTPRVISNADVVRTLGELLPDDALPAKVQARAAHWEMAPPLAVAYLGLRDTPAEAPRDAPAHAAGAAYVAGAARTGAHAIGADQAAGEAPHAPARNLWVQPTLDVEAEYAAVARGQFAAASSAFLTVASRKDPDDAGSAPDGILNVQVMGVAPAAPQAWGASAAAAADGSYRRAPEYRAAKQACLEQLLDAAALAWPDVRARVVHSELASPLTQSRYTGSTGGTSYGLAATPGQFLLARPGVRSAVPGLYLCGASCRAGHGIVGAATSGVHAAAAIAGRSLARDVLG